MQRLPCDFRWLGRIDYDDGLRLQRELVERRGSGLVPDTLLLLEHPPVYTTGRRGPGEYLRLPASALGAPLIETDRGGDITFHGPGQLVAYAVIDLRAGGLGVAGYVRRLEEVIVATLAGYDIEAHREPGLTGVWAGDEKIAAIGVRVSRAAAGAWVTSHGLALNVDVDLRWFDRIIPCGIADRGVTSMRKLLGDVPPLVDVAERLARHFCAAFDREPAGDLCQPSQAFP